VKNSIPVVLRGRDTSAACRQARRRLVWLCLGLLAGGCQGKKESETLLRAEVPLHLEEHLESATVVGSEVPENLPGPVEWRFDAPQPDWKPVSPRDPAERSTKTERVEDALRILLRHPPPDSEWIVYAPDGVYVDLSDWDRNDWAWVEVQARSAGVATLGIAMNLPTPELGFLGGNFTFPGEQVDVVNDGSIQTYRMRADWSWRSQLWPGVWRQFALLVQAKPGDAGRSATLDVISIRIIPKEAAYVTSPVGVRKEIRQQEYRRTIFTHAPGAVEYQVRIPPSGRLDFGLGVLRDDIPVTFRITAERPAGQAEPLFEEAYSDKEHWAQRSVDLSHLAGETVRLGLGVESERQGSVALWAAPTLSGARQTERPNVIFYVIDGAAASQMSVYGHNRRTTPNLERLAALGAVFERAYSNASWTRPSTASFMSSLQHSALGAMRDFRNPPPNEVPTMAEHLHHAGYQTAVLATNPNAGTMSNLDRGVDLLREDFSGAPEMSSQELHEQFWNWRASYPGQPYWVHFQTTDVHEYDNAQGVAPFAGLFVTAARRQVYVEWRNRLSEAGDTGPYSPAFEQTGISRPAFFAVQRDLYDEAMAHQDDEIGQLIRRLEAAGEWGNTLFIVASDHSFLAAGEEDFTVGMLESLPPAWGPMFRPSVTHIPMIFVWPGRIRAGQRFREPVSMIDMLPTILDLLELPQPEVAQGQSLAPLLLGRGSWEPQSVILDEFVADPESGELRGVIEMVDGRWGASLEINPAAETPAELQRPAPLLLYDLWDDPDCLHSLHGERPDLVEKYTRLLERQLAAHLALGQRFSRAEVSPLTPDQLRTLRSLGYID